MKIVLAALAMTLATGSATAQQYASADGYRVCPQAQTVQGIDVVKQACGSLKPPSFSNASFASLSELKAAEAERKAFEVQVAEYGNCVTSFINSYRRPGADANSKAPDQAACAHAWAQDQATEVVRDYGRACVDFSNRSMTDGTIDPWSGACYPAVAGSERG